MITFKKTERMQEKHLMFLETGPEMIEFKNAFLRP